MLIDSVCERMLSVVFRCFRSAMVTTTSRTWAMGHFRASTKLETWAEVHLSPQACPNFFNFWGTLFGCFTVDVLWMVVGQFFPTSSSGNPILQRSSFLMFLLHFRGKSLMIPFYFLLSFFSLSLCHALRRPWNSGIFLDMSQKNITSIQFQKFNTTNNVWT